MSGAEQMHMLASAGINPADSDIEFTSEDEKRYKKNRQRNGANPKASAEERAESKSSRVAIEWQPRLS